MKLRKFKFLQLSQKREVKPFIFIHIQKTAGKSIRHALGLQDGADHRSAKTLRNELDENIWNNSFKFTFVRNPWDRLVSAYFYRTQGGNGSIDDKKRATTYPETFELFCEQIHRFQSLENESMFICQKDWITDNDSRQIIDFVGHVENIQSDFDIICDTLNKPHVKLPHMNRSAHGAYRDIYNARTKKLIAAAYEEDIDLFGYTF